MENNAILIFIGCDKVGKSTLFSSMVKRTNKYICIDRLFPCQQIYGEINNKKNKIIDEKIFEIEKFLSNSPIPFIYVWVDSDTEVIKERFIKTNEKDIELNQIGFVRDMYEKYFETHNSIPVIYVNNSKLNIDETLDLIEELVYKTLNKDN